MSQWERPDPGKPWGGGPHVLRRVTGSHGLWREQRRLAERGAQAWGVGTRCACVWGAMTRALGREGEWLTSEQQPPPPQVCLCGREVTGNRVDAHASALEPLCCRPAAGDHLERPHTQWRRRLQQHPATQLLPAAVRTATRQLQPEAAQAPQAHGAGLSAPRGRCTRRGARPAPAATTRVPRVSALVLTAPGVPVLSPARANLCRRLKPRADFLVLRVRPLEEPGWPRTCVPLARPVDFVTHPHPHPAPHSTGRALFFQGRRR